MAEEKPAETPSLHIDTDWKKQAQEEKRRLAEQAQQAKAAPPALAGAGSALAAGMGTAMPGAGALAGLGGPGPAAVGPADPAARGGRPTRGGRREVPPVSFSTLVQSLMTQVLFYLGEIQGNEPNLDLAKHQLDTLGMLEEKTTNNLSPEEKQFLDTALYEARNRFVGVASQFMA